MAASIRLIYTNSPPISSSTSPYSLKLPNSLQSSKSLESPKFLKSFNSSDSQNDFEHLVLKIQARARQACMG